MILFYCYFFDLNECKQFKIIEFSLGSELGIYLEILGFGIGISI